MSVTIPSEFQTFIAREIASGRYRSETEIVEHALRMFCDSQIRLDRLQGDLDEGLADLNAGRCSPFSVEDVVRLGRKMRSGTE
jgi:antitoxin ParD1/3/4